MENFTIKGISLKIDNLYFVDINPNDKMNQILNNQKYSEEERQCAIQFLNVGCSSCNVNNGFDLLLGYQKNNGFTLNMNFLQEKQSIIDFINKWKDKLPIQTCADDFEFTNALSDDIPWKKQVIR